MTETLYERHARHIGLPAFGPKAQKNVSKKRVLVLGLGGLGTLVSQYLVGAGVERIVLVDKDHIELSNLSRQILYTTDDIGQNKVDVAKARLQAVNPQVEILAYHQPDTEHLQTLCEGVDLIIDGLDNFESRYILNGWSRATPTPLLTASVIGMHGQVMLLTQASQTPCYACLYPDNHEPTSFRCVDSGVLNTAVAQVASMQAHLAMMFLAEKNVKAHQLFCFDGEKVAWRDVVVVQDKDCVVCGV